MLDQRAPTLKELVDEILLQRHQISEAFQNKQARASQSSSTLNELGYNKMTINGKEVKLKDSKEDQANLLERESLIKKLDKNFVK